MKKHYTTGLIAANAMAFFYTAPFANAQADPTQYLSDISAAAEIDSSTTLPQLIGRFINVVIGLLGVIFLVQIVYAGYLYLLAGDDSGNVDKAKSLVRNAVIGIIIIIASFAISSFVIEQITTATTG